MKSISDFCNISWGTTEIVIFSPFYGGNRGRTGSLSRKQGLYLLFSPMNFFVHLWFDPFFFLYRSFSSSICTYKELSSKIIMCNISDDNLSDIKNSDNNDTNWNENYINSSNSGNSSLLLPLLLQQLLLVVIKLILETVLENIKIMITKVTIE